LNTSRLIVLLVATALCGCRQLLDFEDLRFTREDAGSGGGGGQGGAGGDSGAGGEQPDCGAAVLAEAERAPILFRSTLDDLEAAQTPLVGNGPGVVDVAGDVFVPALRNSGLRIDAASEHVRWPGIDGETPNVLPHRGTVDFCLLPLFSRDDGVEYWLWNLSDTEPSLVLAREGDGTLLFQWRFDLAVGGVRVAAADNPLEPGRWFRVTFSWSFTGVPEDSAAMIQVDGAPLPGVAEGEYPGAVPQGVVGHPMKLNHELGDSPLGIYDELVVYAEALASP
jgi:hypothetical protein